MKRHNKRILVAAVFVPAVAILFIVTWKIFYPTRTTEYPLPQEQVIRGKLTLPPGLSRTTDSSEVQIALTVPTQHSNSAAYLPILLTGLFTLLGSAIVLAFNHLASGSTRKFEWAKHVWETYQGSYLDLRHTIGNTTDPHLVQKKVESLRDRLFLPLEIDQHLTDLIIFLRTSELAADKEKRVADFLIEFDMFLQQPWKFL